MSKLSTGAKVGIGVGVSVAVIGAALGIAFGVDWSKSEDSTPLWGCSTSATGASKCVQMESGGKWKTPEECKCWKCSGSNNGTCMSVNNNSDGKFASEAVCKSSGTCGSTPVVTKKYACSPAASNVEACVQVESGGVWDTAAQCKCWKCQGGDTCVKASSNTDGVFNSEAVCKSSGTCGGGPPPPPVGKKYACSPMASNQEACVLVDSGGKWDSVDECQCWTCAGTTEARRTCSVASTNEDGAPRYHLKSDCTDTTCEWGYKCVQ